KVGGESNSWVKRSFDPSNSANAERLFYKGEGGGPSFMSTMNRVEMTRKCAKQSFVFMLFKRFI
ncbi:hypothetical protein, partial [Siminovitchia sp. 179-K 8D1 HS]|uniref:hypothetical protein n=1 Tax=Siminovitchia sp. 179-K 8D1 HS TaxID=3142385 RepID=UPI0039A0F715